MWLPEQWARWQEILTEIWRKPGKISAGSSDRGSDLTGDAKKRADREAIARDEKLASEQAISIECAALMPYNITRVVVTGVSPPEPGPEPQSRVVNIKCLEWVPPPTAVVKENNSKKITGTDDNPTNDAKEFDLPTSNARDQSPGLSGEGGPGGPRRDPNDGKAS